MTIKQKITIAFTLIVAAILVLFSFYVYYSYEDYRQDLIYERLFARAEATRQILQNDSVFRKDIFFSLNDQYEAVYDEGNNLVVSTAESSDYVPEDSFLQLVRSQKKYRFEYRNPKFEFKKEGVAFAYFHNGKIFVAIVTAYDLNGRNMSNTLRYSLLFGNLLALIIIGITGYFFSKKALSPFDQIIHQIDGTDVSGFGFRVKYSDKNDEASWLAASFNQLLEKIQHLGENQKHFISYASHELRTPLTVIKGVLQTSLAYDRKDDEWKKSTVEAIGEVNRTIDLANNLLLLAEVEGLHASPDKSDLDPIEMLMDTISYINHKYPEQLLNFELSDRFSGDSVQAVISGFPHLLRSAFVNVLDNACKYSDFKPVDIFLDKEEEKIVLKVIDKGMGILPSDMENIFLPMMRGQNSHHVRGVGVGLTLVQEIVKIHDGNIRLTSVPHEGTIVTIILPLKHF